MQALRRRVRASSPTLSLALLLVLASLPVTPAVANFGAAMAAYQRGDHAAAAREVRTPAEAGDADAQFLLGDLYAHGHGVPQDFVQAHLWYNLAASAGIGVAAGARDQLAARMSAAQVTEAQALARAWRPGGVVVAAGPAPAAVDAAEVQRLLAALGYDPGPADGKPGRRTREAIRGFQGHAGLPVDGEITPALAAALRARVGAGTVAGGSALPATMTTTGETPLAAGPDAGASVLRRLPAGTSVMTGDVRGDWVEVRALPPQQGIGWVPVSSLATAQLAPMPQPAAPASGEGGGLFGGLSRGITGLFGGGASATSAAPTGSTATIGIRGFDTTALVAGRPNAAEFARLDQFAVAPDEAAAFASELGLRSGSIDYLPEPAPTAGSGGAVEPPTR